MGRLPCHSFAFTSRALLDEERTGFDVGLRMLHREEACRLGTAGIDIGASGNEGLNDIQ